MTWMASFSRDAGFVEGGMPPWVMKVDAVNIGDWPNRFSNLFWDISIDLSSS
jgi:hypothetical protein